MQKATLIVGLALAAGIAGADRVLLKETASGGDLGLVGQVKVIGQEDGSKVFAVEKRATLTSKKTFDIAPEKNYKLSVKIKTQGEEPSQVWLGVAPHDMQNRYIGGHNVVTEKGTITELAKPCKASDTVIEVKDATKWAKSGAHVIAFEAADDESDLPNFNTSAQIKSIEEKDGVYEITLPKAIGKSYPNETKVRQHRIGGGHVYARIDDVANEWTLWEGVIKGSQMRMGTTGKLVLLCNWRSQDKDKTVLFDELTIEEVENGSMAENLVKVKNSGFEEFSSDGKPVAWEVLPHPNTQSGFAVRSTDAFKGESAVRLCPKDHPENKARVVAIRQRIRGVNPGEKYYLKFYLKKPMVYPFIYVCHFRDNAGRVLHEDFSRFDHTVGFSDWTPVAKLITIPAQAEYVDITLSSAGDAVVDEVSFHKVDEQVAEQEGTLVLTEDFSDEALPADWEVVSGQWRIKDGALFAEGHNKGAVILYRNTVGKNIRVEYTTWTDEPPGDLSVLLSNDAQKASLPTNGYFFGFGSVNNTMNKISRIQLPQKGQPEPSVQDLTRSLWEGFSTGIVQGKKHRIVAERNGDRLRLYRDGKLELACEDAFSDEIIGENFGFYIWNSGYIDDVKVYMLPESSGGGRTIAERKIEVMDYEGFDQGRKNAFAITSGSDESVKIVDMPTWIYKDEHGDTEFVEDLCLKLAAESSDSPVTIKKNFTPLDSGIVEFDILFRGTGESTIWLQTEDGQNLAGLTIDSDGFLWTENEKGRTALLNKIEYRRRRMFDDLSLSPGKWYTLRLKFDSEKEVINNIALLNLYTELRHAYSRGNIDQGEYISLGSNLKYIRSGKAGGISINVQGGGSELFLDNLCVFGPVGARTVNGKNILLSSRELLDLKFPPRKDPFYLKLQSMRHLGRFPGYRSPRDNEYFSGEGKTTFLQAAGEYNKSLIREAFVRENREMLQRVNFYYATDTVGAPLEFAEELARITATGKKAEQLLELALQTYASAYLRNTNEEELKSNFTPVARQLQDALLTAEKMIEKAWGLISSSSYATALNDLKPCPYPLLEQPLQWDPLKYRWTQDGQVRFYFHTAVIRHIEQARLLGFWPYAGGNLSATYTGYHYEKGEFIDEKLWQTQLKPFKKSIEKFDQPIQNSIYMVLGTHYACSSAPNWWLDKYKADKDIYFCKNDGTPFPSIFHSISFPGAKTISLNFWNRNVQDMNEKRMTAVAERLRATPEIQNLAFVLYGTEAYNELQDSQETGHNSSAVAAFQDKIGQHYGDIGTLNRKWHSNYQNFSEITPPQQRTPPSPLQYEFQKFRQTEYFTTFLNPAINRFNQSYGEKIPAALDTQNTFGGMFDPTILFREIDIPLFHSYQTWNRKIFPRWLNYLAEAYGKSWGAWENYSSQGLEKMFELEAIKQHGTRDMMTQIIWGNAMPEVFIPWDNPNPWQYAMGLGDHRLAHLLLNYSSSFIRVCYDRALRFGGVALTHPLSVPDVAILEVNSAFYNEFPPGSIRSLQKNLTIMLDEGGWNYGFVYENLLLEGKQKLHGIQLLLVPNGVCMTEQLNKQLEQWVKAGGILVSYGPAGFLNQFGQQSPDFFINRTTLGSSWQNRDFRDWTLPGTKPVFEQAGIRLYQKKISQGSVFTFSSLIQWEEMRDQSINLLKKHVVRKLGSSAPELELSLRDAPDGKFLYVLNYDRDHIVESEIYLTGEYRKVVDSGLRQELVVPSRIADGKTFVKIRLHPVEATLLKFIDKTTAR